jgi:hypothetical protein
MNRLQAYTLSGRAARNTGKGPHMAQPRMLLDAQIEIGIRALAHRSDGTFGGMGSRIGNNGEYDEQAV